MKEYYSREEIQELESDLKEAVKELEPELHFSLEIPQIQEGFLRVDVYPLDEDNTPEQKYVAQAVDEQYDFETEWEECYSTELMFSLSIYDSDLSSSSSGEFE